MTLREIYIADLNQLLQATRQKLLEWPVMAARAQARMVRDVFDEYYAQTRTHLDTLESLFQRLDERPRQQRADAFDGVLDLWRSRHRDLAAGDIRELSLISAAMAADYHTLPIYADAVTVARSIGDLDGGRALHTIMNEERDRTDRLAVFYDWLATRLSGEVRRDQWSSTAVSWTGEPAAVDTRPGPEFASGPASRPAQPTS